MILIHYLCGIALIIFAIVTLQCLPLWERIYSTPTSHASDIGLDQGTLVDVKHNEQDSKCVLWCGCPLELLLSLREQVLGGCGHISLGSRLAQNQAKTKLGKLQPKHQPSKSHQTPTAHWTRSKKETRNAYCYQPLGFGSVCSAAEIVARLD